MTAEPRGYWSASSSHGFAPEDAHRLEAALAQATEEGRTLVVVDGVTLTWHDATAVTPPDPADLARDLQDIFESQPAITIRRGVEPQVAWRALADELLRRWGR